MEETNIEDEDHEEKKSYDYHTSKWDLYFVVFTNLWIEVIDVFLSIVEQQSHIKYHNDEERCLDRTFQVGQHIVIVFHHNFWNE